MTMKQPPLDVVEARCPCGAAVVHSDSMECTPETAAQLLDWVDAQRRAATAALDPEAQRRWGQYFTPASVAQVMASTIAPRGGPCTVLDPGAGVGVLAASAAITLCEAAPELEHLRIVVYELDATLVRHLRAVLGTVRNWARTRGITVSVEVHEKDFLEDAAILVRSGGERFADVAILNPPYGKIAIKSRQRDWARSIGVETSNMYAAFWAAAVRLTRPGGDVVAITPRSFCNGAYFRRFRRFLLQEGAIRRLHVFDRRDRAFAEDSVLQENLVTHIRVGGALKDIDITAQSHPGAPVRHRTVPYGRVVQPADPDSFIHVVPDADADHSAELMSRMTTTLVGLGLEASTGRVVDFRAKELLRADPVSGTVPLVYPGHLRQGLVVWPRPQFRKANAIEEAGAAEKALLVPDGDYVVIKRFTAKEERRRIVAALFEGGVLGTSMVGFENHLNYVHAAGRPLSRELAVGMVLYLNSSAVDDYFRQFSGHTQVNAGDLRSLRYPAEEALKEAGARADLSRLSDQSYVDELTKHFLIPWEDSHVVERREPFQGDPLA